MRRPRIRLPRPPEDARSRSLAWMRALGQSIREKAQVAGTALRRRARRAATLWTDRPPETRRRLVAVAAVAGVYAILKLAAVPGVPCQVSAAKECSPGDGTIALVPSDALLYGHLTLERDNRQYELASELAGELPNLQQLAGQLVTALPTPPGTRVDAGEQILPWAEDDLALVLLPGPGDRAASFLVAGVRDDAAAEEFLEDLAGEPRTADHEGSSISLYRGGFAAARVDDRLAFGSATGVRAALDVAAGRSEPLAEGSGPRGDLPELRFADLYVSRAGVDRLLGSGGAGATQLDTFVNYGATEGMAASATARERGVEVNLVSELDPELLPESPTVFAELPRFEPALAEEAGARALGYVGVGELGPTLSSLLEGAGGEALARPVRRLARTLSGRAGVDPVAEFLPALGGQAALIAEPTDGLPYASLLVEGVDEERAREALARIEVPLVRSLRAPGRRPRGFEEQELDGVTVRSLRLSGTVNLSYAVFDGMLVVSTDPAGIAQVRSDGDDLAGAPAFERATDDLPGEVSALVFLNLDELLGLAEQAGLAEDPLYATLSDDISHFGSLALAVTGDEDQLRTELFLATD